MASGFSRDRWEENIFDKVGQPTCSAVVYQAKGKTIAKVWDENHDRFKILAQKKAGVDDAGVIQSAIDVRGTIILKEITATVTPLKLYDNTHLIMQNCKLTLADNSNDSLLKIYDATNVKITGVFELNGNKSNQTTEPSSGIRVLSNYSKIIKVNVEGIIKVHDFLSQGIDVVATPTSRTITTLTGNFELYNNGRNGVYIGYNAELYHSGFIESYSNGSVAEGDGLTSGDIKNVVKIDTIYTHDNFRAGVSVWRTNYVKISNLIAENNSTHGLYIERPANNVFVMSMKSVGNGQDGVFLINGTSNPEGECKNVFIKGVAESNARRGITIAYDSIDMSNVFLELTLRNNGDRGIQSYSTTYKLKYSIIKFESVGNSVDDLINNKDTTTKIISGGWSNSGTATFSGDGTTTTFTIPHGLVSTPSNVQVTPKSQDAAGNFYVTVDATNIYVNYLTAPPLGTDNVVLDWSAEV